MPADQMEDGGNVQVQGGLEPEQNPEGPAPGSPATPVNLGFGSAAGSNSNVSNNSDSAGSEQGPIHFRNLSDLYDTTEQIYDYEYSGLCLLAADEPGDVEEALWGNCWKEAMNAKLQSISENNTWELAKLPKGQRAIGLK